MCVFARFTLSKAAIAAAAILVSLFREVIEHGATLVFSRHYLKKGVSRKAAEERSEGGLKSSGLRKNGGVRGCPRIFLNHAP